MNYSHAPVLKYLTTRPSDIQQALGTKRQSVPIDEQGNVALGLESGYVGTPAKSALVLMGLESGDETGRRDGQFDATWRRGVLAWLITKRSRVRFPPSPIHFGGGQPPCCRSPHGTAKWARNRCERGYSTSQSTGEVPSRHGGRSGNWPAFFSRGQFA